MFSFTVVEASVLLFIASLTVKIKFDIMEILRTLAVNAFDEIDGGAATQLNNCAEAL